jgi:predicted RecB family nuclease
MKSRPVITEKSFYKFLKCPNWLYKKWHSAEEDQQALLAKLQTDGLLRKSELSLLTDREVTEVDLDDMDEAAQRTVELMKQGVQTIYRGALIHEHYVARPDVLERVEGESEFGDWYYIACDIKRSSRVKDEYKMEGAFYAMLLQRIQGLRPVNGYVIFSDQRVENYLIADVFVNFRLTLDDIEDIFEGKKPKHFLTSGYKQSPHFDEFVEEVKACDHLSLLNRVWRSEVYALEDAGIATVEALANTKMEDLKKVNGVTMDRLYFLQQQAISMKDGRVIRVGDIELPEEIGPVLIVDIESDPMRDLHYLFGVLVVEGEKQVYHQFLAKTPEEEQAAWEAFTAFVENYPTANLYHYGWYEVDVFRRLVEKYGASDAAQEMFAERMIDLLRYLRGSVIFPSPFYSLKDIAKHLGFAWRIHDASGLDSVLWYHKWLDEGDKVALQDTIEYNEDDVRATWYVREWVMKNLVNE